MTENPGITQRPLAVAVPDAAKLIGVGQTSMWALIREKKVKASKIGKRTVVSVASLEALLAAHTG